MSTRELIGNLRPLPAAEKRAFVERVWEQFGEELGAVDDDLSPEQKAELNRRMEDTLKKPGRRIPWEQVRDEVVRLYEK